MDIKLQEDPSLPGLEVLIRCPPQLREEAFRLLRALEGAGPKTLLTGLRDGQTYPLSPEDLLYIDTVDRRTFLYTAEGVYETGLRLYELEARLGAMEGQDFLRASKSVIVNFNAIKSLRPDLGGRLRLTMRGGEAVYVSRQYAPAFKKKLGLA